MTSHRFEVVLPDAALFLALVRGRVVAPDVPSLAAAIPAAAARAMSRESLAEAIVPRLRTLGAPTESIAAAERLRVPGTVCVVAGQQPVLFGGPHFIVTKALATVALARRVEASGTPCVPVFWVASEDHDHAEVDHVDVGRRGDDAVRLTVPLPGDRRMLSRVTMPPETADVVAQLATLLPAGPGRDDALAAVSPWAGDTVGAAFARTMLHLCGRFGLVVVEPDALRTHAREVIDHELAHPGELAATIAAVEDSFAARGFTRPLALRHRQLFFVVDREGKRHVPQGLPAPDDAKALASWRKRLAEQPERFSWNVAGRVLAQDVALPVAAQVCGPSELGYCATLGAAHARLGVVAPALVARPGVTFAESEGDAPDASQERKLSILPFLARRGSGMLDDMLEAISRPDVEHEVVRLGGA